MCMLVCELRFNDEYGSVCLYMENFQLVAFTCETKL